MKRIILTLCLLASSATMATLFAQNTLSSIRQRYANTKETIAHMMQEDGIPAEYYQVNVFQNLPGTGPHREDVRMYYDEVGEAEEIYLDHRLSFATTSYNFAARKFYEEYLYDADGKVAFAFVRDPDIVFGMDYDFRFYFSRGKLIHAIVKRRLGENANPDAFKDTWDASLPVDAEGFQEVFVGNNLPKEFGKELSNSLQKAKVIHNLFENVDGALYLK